MSIIQLILLELLYLARYSKVEVNPPKPGPLPNKPNSNLRMMMMDDKHLNSFNTIRELSGISVTEVPRPVNLSQTECVGEIAAGNLDLCLGDFWITSLRSSMAPFLGFIDAIDILLLTKPLGTNSIGMFDAFLHIKYEVWLSVLIFQGAMALLYYTQELRQNNEEFGSKNFLVNSVTLVVTDAIGLFSGRSAHKPQTIPGKLVVTAMSLFYLIFFAVFIASITAFFMIHYNNIECADVECILREKKTIQVPSVIYEEFKILNPEMYLQGLILTEDDIINYSKASLPEDPWQRELQLGIFALMKGYVTAIAQPVTEMNLLYVTLNPFESRFIQDDLDPSQCNYILPNYSKKAQTIQEGMPVSPEWAHQMNFQLQYLIDSGYVKYQHLLSISSSTQEALLAKGIGECKAEPFEFGVKRIPTRLFYGLWYIIAGIFGIAVSIKLITQIQYTYFRDGINKNLKQWNAFFKKIWLNFSQKPKLRKDSASDNKLNLSSNLSQQDRVKMLSKQDQFDQYDEPKLDLDQEIELMKQQQTIHMQRIWVNTFQPQQMNIKQQYKLKYQKKNKCQNQLKSLETVIENNGRCQPTSFNLAQFKNIHEMNVNAFKILSLLDEEQDDVTFSINKQINFKDEDYEQIIHLENAKTARF